MRTPRPTSTVALALALPVVGLSASVTAAAAPASDARSAAAPRVVDIRTYSGRWVVPSVEWSVTTVARRSAADLPTSWRMRPVAPGSSTYKIVTVATTDGEPACLTAVEETVGLEDCAPGMRDQRFRVASGDSENQVTITGRLGVLNTDPDGSLYLGDADEPSAVFTLRRPRPTP